MWVEGQNGTGGSGDPLTPNNATPAAIALNHVYEAQGNGYAIQSYRTVVPDDASPPYITEGEIIKTSTYDGYLRRTLESPYDHGPNWAMYYADTSNVILSSIREEPTWSQLVQTSEDGVLLGTIDVKWSTAKPNGAAIEVYSVSDNGIGITQPIMRADMIGQIPGNKSLIMSIGSTVNTPYPLGIFIPKGSRLGFEILAAAGGTRTLANDLKVYGIRLKT